MKAPIVNQNMPTWSDSIHHSGGPTGDYVLVKGVLKEVGWTEKVESFPFHDESTQKRHSFDSLWYLSAWWSVFIQLLTSKYLILPVCLIWSVAKKKSQGLIDLIWLAHGRDLCCCCCCCFCFSKLLQRLLHSNPNAICTQTATQTETPASHILNLMDPAITLIIRYWPPIAWH